MVSATGTSPAARGIGVFDGKSAPHRAGAKIDLRPVQVQRHFLRRYQLHPVLIVTGVDGRVEVRLESERILKTGATAAGDADAEHRTRLGVLCFHMFFNFFGRRFGDGDCHCSSPFAPRAEFA